MSCEVECIASGVQCMGQLAVEVGAGAPEGRGRRGKGRVRAHGRQGEGPWCVCVCGALLLELVGARSAAPAALLPREPRSPDASAACVGAKRKQRENPRRGRWGEEGARHTSEAPARWWGGGGKGLFQVKKRGRWLGAPAASEIR